MAWVDILRGSTGRHYIDSTINLERRLSEHRRSGTHTTQRLGEQLETVAVLELKTIEQARMLERQLKAEKNPRLGIGMLRGLRPPTDPSPHRFIWRVRQKVLSTELVVQGAVT